MKNTGKVIKIMDFIIVILWVIMFFCIYFGKVNDEKMYAQNYLRLTQESEYFNIAMNSSKQQSEIDTSEQLFFNAKSAFLYSWNNFINANSYKYYGFGEGTGSALNQSVKIVCQSACTKWAPNEALYETGRYQVDSSIVNVTKYDIYYLLNGKRYQNSTENLSYHDNKIFPNYSGGYGSGQDNPFLYMCYDINENTIVKDLYFKCNRNVYTKQIESYNCSVCVNVVTGTKTYREFTAKEVHEINGLPWCEKLNFDCIIAPDGTLISFGIDEKLTFNATYGGGIITADVCFDSYMKFYVTDINKPISDPRPQVNL